YAYHTQICQNQQIFCGYFVVMKGTFFLLFIYKRKSSCYNLVKQSAPTLSFKRTRRKCIMAKVSKAELPLMAEQIVQCLGGKDNIARINHCASRLRVNPVDSSKVDKDGLKKIKGVIGIDASTGE